MQRSIVGEVREDGVVVETIPLSWRQVALLFQMIRNCIAESQPDRFKHLVHALVTAHDGIPYIREMITTAKRDPMIPSEQIAAEIKGLESHVVLSPTLAKELGLLRELMRLREEGI